MPTVLITGANRGFGRELLEVYINSGWTVFPLVRKQEDANALISSYDSNCHPIISDVSSDDVIDAIANVLTEHTSSLDLLINNAGSIKKTRGVEGADPDDLQYFFDVHCVGALRCVKASLPFLQKASHPVVVNISSRFGSITNVAGGSKEASGRVYSYMIAKAAQNMLTALLSHDLGTDNIRVVALHPGRLKTASAAADADIDPYDAALRFFDFASSIDKNTACQLFDLTTGEIINW